MKSNKFIGKQQIKLVDCALISESNNVFNTLNRQKVSVIGDLDVSGISVADLLRNPSNLPYYNQRGSSAFAQVVDRILNNNNYYKLTNKK